MPPILAYNESSLPASSLDKRLQLAAQHHLALEIANSGHLDLEPYLKANIPIAAVQAYAMHDVHPLHPDAQHRQQALHHVHQTLEIAAQLQVPRIVTVCGFGSDVVDSPFERCLDFFSHCAAKAKTLGIKIMIEPLSPRRCEAMTEPYRIGQLVDTLAEPEVFTTLLDTGHLLDSGYDLEAFLPNWPFPTEELQLKGPHSTPPDFSLRPWLMQLPFQPAVLCVEHRQPITLSEFEQLISAIRLEFPLNND
ncbi:sugar phosphate isomerase/epimerase [Acaryochloris marina]|uniref:sugar phosphate isomerase/epimerase family protein n=1 Tax=Acaryochloris marina TaxID=155978 RepID=UPI001BAF780B|nr:TIM barrel protein [Acaryochloris marina]QUY41495.1 TIM barrel protein [Acaryochloris marina S15]